MWLSAGVLCVCLAATHARAQDILFVTQPPFGNDFTTINSTFGNHLGHTGAAPRGGDLYLRYDDGTLRNLTAEAGYGTTAGAEIAVREPTVHWSGSKALFSMVVGGTTQNDYSPVYWQIYEVTGLEQGATVSITRLSQPADFNNVSPLYGTDDRILFTSDRPRNGDRMLYPQLDEYESAPTNTGLWSMNADGSDLRLLDHAVSGVFTPIVTADGRVLATRWDHLQRDQQNYEGASYGAFNYVSEFSSETTGDAAEVFPESRNRQGPIHGHRINIFLPWQIFEDGTGHETLNHVGRHELSHYFDSARDGLPEFIPPASRRTADRLFHLAEDPNRPGYFFATYAPEFQTHSAGQIVGLDGAEDVNADDMEVDYVSDPVSDAPAPDGDSTPPGHPGLFRNPLPLADGGMIAVRSTEARPDRRTGGPLSSRYDFHLTRMVAGEPYMEPGARLIPGGISKSISYFDNYEYRQHSYDGVLWELDPVEVRPRPRPSTRTNPLPAIEADVLADELGATGTAALRAFLVDNQLALVVSRNVTRRADRQQDFNLKVADSTTETAEPGSTPAEVAFMQFFQADQIRGYANFNDGRRPIATAMHDGLLAPLPGAPPASVPIAADGSMAAFVPAARALTWHLTDGAGGSVVKERFWVSFAAGEIRVCANCHGLNRTDVVLDEGPPTNEPQALRDLVSWWQQNYGPPETGHAVSGRVSYYGSGVPVSDVVVDAVGGSSYATQSDGGGGFSFDDLTSGVWQVTPRKDGGRAGAVTAYDASMVLRHVLGLDELDPLASAACDVTGNGSVSSLDAVRILQLALGAMERFAVAEQCGSDWIFAPSIEAGQGGRAVEPLVAPDSCTAGAIAFEPLDADVAQRDFVGRVFGDCSGNWNAATTAGLSSVPRPNAILELGRPRASGRRLVDVPILLHATQPLHSLDLRITARDGRAMRFRKGTLPEGTLLRRARAADGGLGVGLASGRALGEGTIRIGTLRMRGKARLVRLERLLQVEALVDDRPARIAIRR